MAPTTVYLFTADHKFYKEYANATICGKEIGTSRTAITNAMSRRSLVLSKYYVSPTKVLDTSTLNAGRNPLHKAVFNLDKGQVQSRRSGIAPCTAETLLIEEGILGGDANW